jgi:hypothetical protein
MTKKLLSRIVLFAIVQLTFTVMAGAMCRDTLKTYYGFLDINGGENCGVIIGPQPTYTLVVGEEYWDCDGNYTQWGLICNGFYDITHTACECTRDPLAAPTAAGNAAAEPLPSVMPVKLAPDGEMCN